MNTKRMVVWFSTIPVILFLFGVLFAFWGLEILPVQRQVLLRWESALYGSIMMGWGITLFLAGRLGLQRSDSELMKALWYGITVWLVVEASFSAYLGVWFNVGVCVGILGLFSIPLLSSILKSKVE